MTRHPATILLAEDNPAHAMLVRRRLECHKLKSAVFHVADGEAALDFLFRRGDYTDPSLSPRPDVVLLDLRMPRIDGLEVLQKVKSNNRLATIPVVVLTTSEADSDIDKAYEYRANSYLVKPIDFAAFSEMIEDFGSYWLSWNRFAGCPAS